MLKRSKIMLAAAGLSLAALLPAMASADVVVGVYPAPAPMYYGPAPVVYGGYGYYGYHHWDHGYGWRERAWHEHEWREHHYGWR